MSLVLAKRDRLPVLRVGMVHRRRVELMREMSVTRRLLDSGVD